MVKFPFDTVQKLVLAHWDDKDTAPIVFYIGVGSLNWLVWNGTEFCSYAEVQGISPAETSKAKYTENFFILPTRRLIQVSYDAITVQLMPDDELLRCAELLNKKRINDPQFVPYDAEWSVLDHERTRRWAIRNGRSTRSTLRRLGDEGIVDL